MKDTIAARVKRADYGERRVASPLAKGMRRLIGGVLLLCAWLVLPVNAATAQQSDWIEPARRYSLGFESLGWTATPNLARAPNILAFVRNDSPRDDRMRLCFVREDAVPYSQGSTQATANQILDRWDEARLSQILGSPVMDMAHVRIADVSAIDYRLQRESLDVMSRLFMVRSGAGMDQIIISCTAPAPFTGEEISSINAVFSSLQFYSRTNQ